MTDNFDDFCLWAQVIVDDIWQQIAAYFKRPGPKPLCSDSELLTMVLVGECRGWELETDMLSHWQAHRDLFRHIPSQSRLNRRRRQLKDAFHLIQCSLLHLLDLAQEGQCAIDSLPVPVVQFHLAPQASWQGVIHGADFGKVSSKKQTIFGYKLHLLVTLSGVIIDFTLAPARVHDRKVGEEMLCSHTHLDVFGDKAYSSKPVAETLRVENCIHLHTLPRTNQKVQVPPEIRRLHNRVRQIVETVNGHLVGQLNIQRNHAHTFWGLCTRLLNKLTAHTLSIYIHRLLGKSAPLQIKALAFPN